METMEIIIYIVLALMLGLLTLSFIKQWDYEATYDAAIQKKEAEEFHQVDDSRLIEESVALWHNCRFGTDAKNMTVYYIGAQMTDTLYFDYIKKHNLCSEIESEIHECGTGEDVVFQNFSQAVVRIACNPLDHKLYIGTNLSLSGGE